MVPVNPSTDDSGELSLPFFFRVALFALGSSMFVQYGAQRHTAMSKNDQEFLLKRGCLCQCSVSA